jgi:hypothetical protein
LKTWVDQIGTYSVQRRESRRPSGQAYLRLANDPSFCIHTTEGNSVDGAWATLDSRHSAPHFIVGEGRIVQLRPLWAQAATLRSHNDLFIQVECVGHASLELHTLTPSTWEPLVELTRYLHEQGGIPLSRPSLWDDKLPGSYWAWNNSRRTSRLALIKRGVYGHIDIPDQDPTWHWDPGSLNYTQLFEEATSSTQEADDMTPEEKKKLNEAHNFATAVKDALAANTYAGAGTKLVEQVNANGSVTITIPAQQVTGTVTK